MLEETYIQNKKLPKSSDPGILKLKSPI
jgi:hypothetical protein